MLLVYVLLFTVALVAVLISMRGDESLFQKWARVRVRTDENRRKNIPDRREEEFESNRKLGLLLIGAILLLICLLLSKV